MFGLFNKQKGIKDLKENDLQKLFDEAEKMYKSFSKQRNDILASDFKRLKKDDVENGYDKDWIEFTKQAIENNQKELSKVKEVRENVIRLIEREAHTSIEKRFQNYRDWYDYMHTFLYWYVDTSISNGDWTERDNAEQAKNITLEEIAKRLKAKLAQMTH